MVYWTAAAKDGDLHQVRGRGSVQGGGHGVVYWTAAKDGDLHQVRGGGGAML